MNDSPEGIVAKIEEDNPRPGRKTPRGFAIYAEVEDRYGAKIRVQKSSLAFEDCVWIFAEPSGRRGDSENPSPHLTVEQAEEVIRGLQEFVDENKEE